MRLERILEIFFLSAAIISVSVTVFIFGFMFFLGLPLIEGGHFFRLLTQSWTPARGIYGIYPMIIGTLSIASLALLISIPLSFGCASLICNVDR